MIKQVIDVLMFGWPFIKKYWFRFYLGVGLGLAFAGTNALFVGAMYLLFNRLDPGVTARKQAAAQTAPAALPDTPEAPPAGEAAAPPPAQAETEAEGGQDEIQRIFPGHNAFSRWGDEVVDMSSATR